MFLPLQGRNSWHFRRKVAMTVRAVVFDLGGVLELDVIELDESNRRGME
jgi:hypothetical protein